MKLATRKNGSRDGSLVVVSKDLKRFVEPKLKWATLQAAVDDWDSASKELSVVYEKLNKSETAGQPFEEEDCLSPLPRAYEWVDGSAYINHIVLVRKARGAEPPATLRTEPLVYQGGSGTFLSPRQPIPYGEESWGLDFESEIAVILKDVPLGAKKSDADQYIALIMLCNDVSLRGLIPGELQKGFGFFNSKPASAFSPVCVTPDELGHFWKDGRVHLPLVTKLNDAKFGDPNAGPEMFFSFSDLIEHIAKTRAFTAGTILGSGTVSNEDRSKGSSCLMERRMIEMIDSGEMKTPFLRPGDRVEIEMFDPEGASIFGKIDQTVAITV